MILTQDVLLSIDKCVLCWLATVSKDGVPNVSPKEIFAAFGESEIIIANIASPQSAKNISANEFVCVSFIDVLVQKGYQLKGRARLIDASNASFAERAKLLETMTEGLFPFNSIFSIQVDSIKPIIAPRYIFYPDTTESEQVASAKKSYGV